MAQKAQATSGEESLDPVTAGKANPEEERPGVQDGRGSLNGEQSDSSQVECQKKQAESKEEDFEREGQGRAYATDMGNAWKRRVEEMEAEYTEQIKVLTMEAEKLRAQLAGLGGQCCTCKARCKQLEERNEELEDKLSIIQQRAQEQLDTALQKHRNCRSSFFLQLGQERSHSRALKAEVSRLREQMRVLEEQLQMALIELRHREEVLEAFGTQALERVAAAVGPEGRADLLRLIAVLKRSSWPVEDSKPASSVAASTKCDSGYQGSIGEGKGHSKSQRYSDSSVAPPVEADRPDVTCKDVERDEIAEAKRKLRRSNEKVERLLRLTLERERQASLLEDQLSSPETLSKMRTSSSGFVPACAVSPLPGPMRKVLRKKQHLSSTPHGALETLLDVSSICHDATDDSLSLSSQLDEAKDSPGSVFLWESKKRCSRRDRGGSCPDCKVQDSPSLDRTVAKDSGGKPGIRAGSAAKPDASAKQGSQVPNGNEVSSQTSRAPLMVVTKNVSRTSLGDRKTKACRSLDFSRQPAAVPTVPFTFSTGGNNTPTSGASDISFTSAGPVVLNLNLVPRCSHTNLS